MRQPITIGDGWEDAPGAVLPERFDKAQPMGRDWGYRGCIYYDDDEFDMKHEDSLDRSVNPVRWWEAN
jgi:hypothetical protein